MIFSWKKISLWLFQTITNWPALQENCPLFSTDWNKSDWPSFKTDAVFAFLQLSGTKKVALLKVKCLLTQAVHLTRFWSTGFACSFSLGWFALQSLTLFTSRTKKILNNWATYSWALSVRQIWFATKILEFQRTVYSQFKRLNTSYKHLTYFPSILGNQPERIKYQFPHIAS